MYSPVVGYLCPHLGARQVHPARVGEPAAQLGHELLVGVDEHVDGAVADLERRDVGEEVVACTTYPVAGERNRK